MDANDAASYVQDLAGEDANIIFGAMYDDTAVDTARITVIATGLDDATAKMASVRDNTPVKKKVEEKKADTAAAAQPQAKQSAPTLNMPTFSIPAATPITSNVQKKDIQIPDFLKNKR